MKTSPFIVTLCMTSVLAGCDEPKQWNPALPGAHEGSSVGDHARPSAESKKPQGEAPAAPRETGAPPPGGQTRPLVPTPPPAVPPVQAPKE